MKFYNEIKQKEIKMLDKSLRSIKIPAILLERLKKEFDDSHLLSSLIGKPDAERH